MSEQQFQTPAYRTGRRAGARAAGLRTAAQVVCALLVLDLLDQLQTPGALRPAQALWNIYSLLRSVKQPAKHADLFTAPVKDLPSSIRASLAAELTGKDAGSRLLSTLLAEAV